MITIERLNRALGLTLRALSLVAGDEYASRMVRHALSCIMKAKAALSRGNDQEALRLTAWASGSIRAARLARA